LQGGKEMTTKELLQALLDGKKITKKNGGNDAYFQMKGDQLYFCFDDKASSIKLTDLGCCYDGNEEFEVMLLNLKERTFLKAILKSLKEKDKVKTVTVGEVCIHFEDENGDDVYHLDRSELDLKFEGVEKYCGYTLERLGLYAKPND
jgi:hypothetical protein